MQSNLKPIFNELEEKVEEVVKRTPIITNTGKAPVNSWTDKIVSKVRISDLASEFNISECPKTNCGYEIEFDNSRGWFCCIKHKYDDSCDFHGNIVDFMEFCRRGIW